MKQQNQNNPQVKSWGKDKKTSFNVEVTINETSYQYYGQKTGFKLKNVVGEISDEDMESAAIEARKEFSK